VAQSLKKGASHAPFGRQAHKRAEQRERKQLAFFSLYVILCLLLFYSVLKIQVPDCGRWNVRGERVGCFASPVPGSNSENLQPKKVTFERYIVFLDVALVEEAQNVCCGRQIQRERRR
jgi:hypothetical protein